MLNASPLQTLKFQAAPAATAMIKNTAVSPTPGATKTASAGSVIAPQKTDQMSLSTNNKAQKHGNPLESIGKVLKNLGNSIKHFFSSIGHKLQKQKPQPAKTQLA